MSGSAKQWQAALGTPLTQQAATASNPFISYIPPVKMPGRAAALGHQSAAAETQVYDAAAEGRKPSSGNGAIGDVGTATASHAGTVEPWPINTGTPATAGCSAQALLHGDVYTEQQVQTAYGVNMMRARASGTPVITILDLGGGWLTGDLKLAGQCFGYSPPQVDQMQGDGVVTAIENAGPETSLDLQTAAAVALRAQFRLVQTTRPGAASWTDSAGRWAAQTASRTSSRSPTADARSGEYRRSRVHLGPRCRLGHGGAHRGVLVRGGG